MAREAELVRVATPEGRLINHSFFALDIFDAGGKREGKPSYKFEQAFEEDDMIGEDRFEDRVLAACILKWGEDIKDDFLDGGVRWYWDGDELAQKREKNGKPGDAYAGKIVLRGHTIYNKHGEPGEPGGIHVYDEDVEPVDAVNQDKIYRGCYGIVGVQINPYEDDEGRKRVSYYLVAFQKTKDGERLATGSDGSDLFKPVGRQEKRSRRKG